MSYSYSIPTMNITSFPHLFKRYNLQNLWLANMFLLHWMYGLLTITKLLLSYIMPTFEVTGWLVYVPHNVCPVTVPKESTTSYLCCARLVLVMVEIGIVCCAVFTSSIRLSKSFLLNLDGLLQGVMLLVVIFSLGSTLLPVHDIWSNMTRSLCVLLIL